MSFLSGILTGVKTIFGVGQDGTNNVMKVASGIGGWIDEQKFTDEEKATYNKELIGHFDRFMENTIKENTQRSKTRREIALWVIRNWIFMLWVSIFAYLVELRQETIVHDFSAYVYKVATITELLYLVLGVGAFFFGAHIIRQTGWANKEN